MKASHISRNTGRIFPICIVYYSAVLTIHLTFPWQRIASDVLIETWSHIEWSGKTELPGEREYGGGGRTITPANERHSYVGTNISVYVYSPCKLECMFFGGIGAESETDRQAASLLMRYIIHQMHCTEPPVCYSKMFSLSRERERG